MTTYRYAKRYEILLRKLRLENLFNETALILTKESEAATGAYSEPAPDLSMPAAALCPFASSGGHPAHRVNSLRRTVSHTCAGGSDSRHAG